VEPALSRPPAEIQLLLQNLPHLTKEAYQKFRKIIVCSQICAIMLLAKNSEEQNYAFRVQTREEVSPKLFLPAAAKVAA
jgi:hypothetical protein